VVRVRQQRVPLCRHRCCMLCEQRIPASNPRAAARGREGEWAGGGELVCFAHVLPEAVKVGAYPR